MELLVFGEDFLAFMTVYLLVEALDPRRAVHGALQPGIVWTAVDCQWPHSLQVWPGVLSLFKWRTAPDPPWVLLSLFEWRGRKMLEARLKAQHCASGSSVAAGQ